MSRRALVALAWVAGAWSVGVGCGSSEKSEPDDAHASEGGSSGGGVTTGGRTTSGGRVSTGGSASTGGSVATGGSVPNGGGPASGGATASGGAAGAIDGGSGGSVVSDAGRCREIERLRFSTGEHSALSLAVSRLPGGFLLGESLAGPLLMGDESGAARELAGELPTVGGDGLNVGWLVAGTVSEPRFLNIRRKDEDSGYAGHYLVRSYLEGGEPAGPEQDVLGIFTRGSAVNAFVRSYDGESVAVANGHGATWDPRMALIDKDGASLSGEVLLLDTGNSPLIACLSVVGTLHGVLGAAVDGSTDRLRIVELGATGEIVQDVTVPELSYCPELSVDASGVYLSTSPGDVSAGTKVYRVADSSLAQVLTLPPVTVSGEFDTWFAGGEQPLIVQYRGEERSFARWKDGMLVPLSGTFSGDVLRSPLDGRIFLVSHEDYAVSVAEIECGPAE